MGILASTVSVLSAATAPEGYRTAYDLYQEAHYAESVTALNDVIQLDPQMWPAYLLLGNNYVKLRDYPSALSSYEKCLEINRNNPDVERIISELKSWLQRHGKPQKSPAAEQPKEGDHFYFQVGGGISVPTQNWQPAYTLCYGGKLGLGYQLKNGLAFELNIHSFYCESVNYSGSISNIDLRIFPSLKYFFTNADVQPYMTIGAGPNLEFSSTTAGNSITPMCDAMAGAGVEFKLDSSNALFLEADYNLIFSTDAVGQDLPVLGGLRFNL